MKHNRPNHRSSQKRRTTIAAGALAGLLMVVLAAASLLAGCIDPVSLLGDIEEIVEEADSDGAAPPSAPTDLVATATGPTTVDLTWTDVDGEQTYQLQRRITGAEEWGDAAAAIGTDVTTYSDTDLTSETSYEYRLRARNGAGDSEWSETAEVTTEATTTFSVTYDGNGSDSGAVPTDPSLYAEGETVVVSGPGSMAMSGATFFGWDTLAEGGGVFYLSGDQFVMPDEDVTLYAQWTTEPTYTLTYHPNGDEVTSLPVDENNYLEGSWVHVTEQGSLSRVGHTFVTWNASPDGSGTTYSPGSDFRIGSDDIVLYAQWTVNQYDLVYSGNNQTTGTVPVGGTYDYRGNVSAAGQGDLAKDHHWFNGWNTTSSGDGTHYPANTDFSMPAYDLTLYADWRTNEHDLTYDRNGATGGTAPETVEYAYNATVTLPGPGDLTRTGHSFEAWNTADDGSGTRYYQGSDLSMPDADLTLYAEWSTNSHVVSYDANGGSDGGAPPSSDVWDYGDTVPVQDPGTMAREGHDFVAWNTESDGSGTTYDPDVTFDFTMPDHDVTLYAIWSIREVTLTYDRNTATLGTIPMVPQTYDWGTTVTVYNNVGNLRLFGDGHENFQYGGWNTAADGSGDDYAGDAGPFQITLTDDTTLYVKWAEFEIGDMGPAGGLVFYDKGAFDGIDGGWRYIEILPTDISDGAPWGCDGTELDVPAPQNIGDGYTVTMLIKTHPLGGNHTCLEAGTATDLCWDHVETFDGISYSDWFLPSYDELQLARTNLGTVLLNPESGYYWTVTQYDAFGAWAFSLSSGSADPDAFKTEEYRVRPARLF